MMVNALSPSVLERVCSVSAALPQLVSGRSVRLGSNEFVVVKKVTSGGFGAIYTCRQGKETRVLKVQYCCGGCSVYVHVIIYMRIYTCTVHVHVHVYCIYMYIYMYMRKVRQRVIWFVTA